MDLFIGSALSGVAVGTLYGLLGFAIVLLYKATGVANFATGNLGTVSVFVVWVLAVGQGWPIGWAVLAGMAAAVALGAASYLAVIRPRDRASHLNLTIRTLGLFLLLFALVNYRYAVGQPFGFPSILPTGRAFTIGGYGVSWLTLGTLTVALLLAASFAWFFQRTRTGLLFLGLASRPEIAELLGLRTRRLTLIAWAASAVVALVVGLLVVPLVLLTSDMMDAFLLLAFTSAIIGGLTSLTGVFVGGMVVGVLSNVMTVYTNSDTAMLAVFALLILILLLKPEGLLGNRAAERF